MHKLVSTVPLSSSLSLFSVTTSKIKNSTCINTLSHNNIFINNKIVKKYTNKKAIATEKDIDIDIENGSMVLHMHT